MTDNTYLASIYRLEATLFRDSAEKLSETFQTPRAESPRNRSAIPFYFLISHAAELLLKAALLKRGVSGAELKSYENRHGLSNLLSLLEQRGLSISPDTAAVVRGLHDQHQNHALRYTALVDDGKPTYMPPPSLVFTALDELLLLTRISTQGV